MKNEISESTKQFMVARFGIKPEEAVGYHSGICYSKAWVNTQEAADKVTATVKGSIVNGGFLDGMPLGGQGEIDLDGRLVIEVMV